MNKVLAEIFQLNSIEDEDGTRIDLHSNTSKEQGEFLQTMFDLIKPKKTLEVGLAYGLSTLFILEKLHENNSEDMSHLVIEPFPWGNTALHNIKKAGLDRYIDIRNDLSDKVIPSLYLGNHKIQYAYIDTTKLFDTVLQDFYFIDKILEVDGVVIIDDCDTPGINKVVRHIISLPHYTIAGRHGKVLRGWRYKMLEKFINGIIQLIPFKKHVYPNFSFKSAAALGINYRCIAFQKIKKDSRRWDWDEPI